MSTTFGIVKEGKHAFDILLEDREDVFTEVVHRFGMGNYKVGYEILNKIFHKLPDDTPVYALYNTRQGINTIGDIRNSAMKSPQVRSILDNY